MTFRKSMTIFALGYVSLALANLYPVAYIFIPVNVLVGFTGAIFWCAEASYLGKLALNQSRENGLCIYNNVYIIWLYYANSIWICDLLFQWNNVLFYRDL